MDNHVAPVEADGYPFAATRVVLVGARNPLNIGAVARAMSNLGFNRLRLVGAYDKAYREARSGVGAGAVLESAETFATLALAVADCSLVVGTTSLAHRGLHHPLRRLEYGARLIRRHLLFGPAALVFGSEKYGLDNDDLAHCHWLLRIPTRREHGSMNLGQAAALCLYELVRNPRAAAGAPRKVKPAIAGDLERLTARLGEVLELSGYLQPRTAASSTLKLRRMIRRMSLSASDTETWLGMLRQIRWKLENR